MHPLSTFPNFLAFSLFKVQLFPRDFEELTANHMEFFLCRERPILGIDSQPHPNPQTIFVPQLLDIPQIKSQFSGRSGFEKHFGDMLGPHTGERILKNKHNFDDFLFIQVTSISSV